MEEYEDLVPTPEKDGRLVLNYRGWSLVDDVVWTMGRELLVLDISFNSIVEVPPELGDLLLLQEFICSSNKITAFPPQIGKLKRLKLLKCNGNKLKKIPEEIGHCVSLRRIISGENALVTVPSTLANLPNLEELTLCNNRLTKLPPAVPLKIKIVDLSNNPGLKHMIPLQLQGNSDFIKWMCAKWLSHDTEVAIIRGCNKEYEQLLEIDRDYIREAIKEVESAHVEMHVLSSKLPREDDKYWFSWFKWCCLKRR